MITNFFASLVVTMMAFSVNADPLPSLQSIRENNKGVDQLKASNIQMSQELFIQALQKNPHSPEIQLNLGVTFGQQNQPEKAEASYQTALRLAKDDTSKFAALFNLGELAQKAKKKEMALDYYQQALKYDPNSLETKVNIELLVQSGGDGGGGKDDQKQDQEKKDKEDQSGDGKDQKEQDPKDGDKDKEDQKKQPSKGKPQPKQFKSQELSQSDVNKILDELKQQEQKIRAEFNRRDSKEKPRDKDW